MMHYQNKMGWQTWSNPTTHSTDEIGSATVEGRIPRIAFKNRYPLFTRWVHGHFLQQFSLASHFNSEANCWFWWLKSEPPENISIWKQFSIYPNMCKKFGKNVYIAYLVDDGLNKGTTPHELVSTCSSKFYMSHETIITIGDQYSQYSIVPQTTQTHPVCRFIKTLHNQMPHWIHRVPQRALKQIHSSCRKPEIFSCVEFNAEKGQMDI